MECGFCKNMYNTSQVLKCTYTNDGIINATALCKAENKLISDLKLSNTKLIWRR
jgi:hypothetical protein